MTFEPFEKSRRLGQPVTLYLFRYGSATSAFYAYTDIDRPITVNGVTYEPIPIQRGSIKASGTLDKTLLELRTPHDVELAELFRIYPPAQPVTLFIYQGHLEDSDQDFKAVWSGRVVGCARELSEAKFQCEPVSTSMRRPALRRHYQYGCPHALYDNQCRADKEAATRTFAVSGVTSTTVTFLSGWAGPYEPEKYIGGMLEWDSASGPEARTILRVADNTLTLSGYTRGITAGMNVKLVLGCNHQMGDCRDLHDNILNFGGQPFIPTKNPIGTTNNYY